MYDLVVIGGGPAALAAAYFAAGKRLNAVMVYEELGGKVGWLESLTGPQQHAPLPGNELVHRLTVHITAEPGRMLDDRVLGVETTGDGFRLTTERHGTLEVAYRAGRDRSNAAAAACARRRALSRAWAGLLGHHARASGGRATRRRDRRRDCERSAAPPRSR